MLMGITRASGIRGTLPAKDTLMIKKPIAIALLLLPLSAAHGEGAIDPATGQYYPPAGPNGVIDTETGEYLPRTGPEGYTNPRTGQFYPAPESTHGGVPTKPEPTAEPDEEVSVPEPEIPRTYRAAPTGGSGESYCGEDDDRLWIVCGARHDFYVELMKD